MAAQTVYPLAMFPPTVSVAMEEDSHSLTELSRNDLPAPQLVMLANVAVISEGNGSENMAEEKEMMELKNVGSSSYSDSEDESVIRYSFENHREICIVEYPESPLAAAPEAEESVDKCQEEEKEKEQEEEVKEDRPLPTNKQPCSPSTLGKRRTAHALGVESAKKKKPFHCKACNYQAKCEEDFAQHIRIHSANKLIVVRRVEGGEKGKASEGSPGLEFEPAVDGDDIKGVIRCERCGYNTNRYDHYIAHLKHHSKEGNNHRVYKCVICTYTTVSQYHWRKHLRNHFPSKLFTCSHCCYFSDRKNNYVQHIRTHTGERPFQCSQCGYSSSQKTHLTRHMRTHSGERPFKCDSCNYLAANQHEVTRHARQVHNGPKPLCCPYCQYKTADRSNFKKHVELHLNPRQFLCPVCKYAASKKCNLQYHIKSRHPGCNDVSMDVSKVKLRAKKFESETDESRKVHSSGMDEDQDGDEEESGLEMNLELSDTDKEPSPINLSTKSSKINPGQAPESGASHKTVKTPSREKPRKAKEKVDRKGTAKQKKVDKVSEVRKTKESLPTTTAEVESEVNVKKNKRRQKVDKKDARDKNKSKETKEKVQKTSVETVVKERDDQDKLGKGKLDKKTTGKKPEMEEPEKPPKKQRNESNGGGSKEVSSCESPKGEASKLAKAADDTVNETPGKKEYPVKKPGSKSKTKGLKRKATEALDLSMKTSPEEPCTRDKRTKVKATDKPQSKPCVPQTVPESCEPRPITESCEPRPITESCEPRPITEKKGQTMETVALPAVVKLKKTKKTNRKEAVVTSAQEKSLATDTSTPQDEASSHTDARKTPGQKTTPTSNTEDASTGKPETPSVPEKTDVSAKAKETSETSVETPSPTGRGSSPIFRRPQGKPTSPSLDLPVPRDKPTDTEDDEGIHSHDGGSDISDSVSEGSDDSGTGKLADPETPTDEIPTPTELKCHTCIFCDRTFPAEVDYRRHLNRHLVNVYYLDNEAKTHQ
ncbi:RE1-silencing transcription factor isoform X1 [Osmerus eperlanus]|uniref:RE1-silencing transcription factor isoform X1 n=1 Tax=Osmerus eperlanus TaxID=29151 RepID=UPI002E12E0FD